MNERIKALAVKADFALYEDGNFRADPGQWINEELEKFAKLIVRECIDCAEWVGRMNTTAVEPVNTAHAIVKRIEKHFGVEK